MISFIGKINAIEVYDADCFPSECTSICDAVCLTKGYKNGWYCRTSRPDIGCCCLKKKKLNQKITPSNN